MGQFGPSVGHRAGYDAGFIFGSPKSGLRSMIWLGFAVKQAMGAGAGMGMEWLNALHDLTLGNHERAFEAVLPGSFKDLAKAYRLGTEGQMAGKQQVSPASFGDVLLEVLGFQQIEREQKLAGHHALAKAIRTQQEQQRMNKGEQLKAKHRTTILGVPVSRKSEALGREYQRAYWQRTRPARGTTSMSTPSTKGGPSRLSTVKSVIKRAVSKLNSWVIHLRVMWLTSAP